MPERTKHPPPPSVLGIPNLIRQFCFLAMSIMIKAMNLELLRRLYSTFDASPCPPSEVFDPNENEPHENPNWFRIFAQPWDEMSMYELRMNWDAFFYFTNESLTYYVPLVLKFAIIDPRSVDLLQCHFLGSLLCGSVNIGAHDYTIKEKFSCIHWEFILEVISQHRYLNFCKCFGALDELDRAVSFLNHLLNSSTFKGTQK